MKSSKLIAKVLGAFLACAALVSGADAKSDVTNNGGGTEAVYGHVRPDQVEFLSTPERLISVASSGSSSAIWEALEHGEKVECLQCIPAIAPLMYDQNEETREIAAWWLRRRIFGVFGKGQVYEQTLSTLKSHPDPVKRAYAAQAIGEFLAAPGIKAVAEAVRTDADPKVRGAAALALGRLNDDGAGALSVAMADADPGVKLSALKSAGYVNTFNDVPAVARLIGDGDGLVRRRAVQVLDSLRAKDSAAALMSIAKNDPDADVRLSACHALGTLHEGGARALLEDISAHDANSLVRDQARIALRRL